MEEPIPTRYNYLRQQGFDDKQIEGYLREEYYKAGFVDQEINSYFAKHKLPGDLGDSVMRGYFNPTADPEENIKLAQQLAEGQAARREASLQTYIQQPLEGQKEETIEQAEARARYYSSAGENASYGDVLKEGWNSSVVGMGVNRLFGFNRPEESQLFGPHNMEVNGLTQRERESLPFVKRAVLGLASLGPDTPIYAIGALAGSGNPIMSFGGAMGLHGYLRAMMMDAVENGRPQDFYEFLQRQGFYLVEGAKGFATGAATGAMGGPAAGFMAELGGGAFRAMAAKGLAEAGTLTVVGAGLEGRIPHPQEFVDTFPLIFTMQFIGGSGPRGRETVNRINQDVAPKLRETYAATGMMPQEVIRAAQHNPTVLPELLSKDVKVLSEPVEQVRQRVFAGEELPVSELASFQNLAWGRAAMAEATGGKESSARLAAMFDRASQGDVTSPHEYWGVVKPEESALLSVKTKLDLHPGMLHLVDAEHVRHIYTNHGTPETELPRGQIPITAEDIAAIPQIIRDPKTEIKYTGKNESGLDTIQYSKKVNGHIIILEEIRTGKNVLALITMRKMKNPDKAVSGGGEGREGLKEATGATSPLLTPEALSDPKSAELMPDSKPVVSDKDITLAANKVNPSIASNIDLPYIRGRAQGTEVQARLSDIIGDIGKALDVPIRTGRISVPGAAGIYKTDSKIIRTRIANDVSTIMHEAGHHLQNIVFGEVSETPLKPFAKELEPLATRPRPGQSNLPEGFAEFVAKYVVDPAEAKNVAPEFYKHFEETLTERNPQALQAFKNAQEGVRLYTEQPAMAEVLSHIDMGEGKGGLLSKLMQKETWQDIKLQAKKYITDDLAPLEEAVKAITNGEKIPDFENPYILARLYRGAGGKAEHFIERSPFKFGGKMENVGRSLKDIVRDVEKIGDINEFRAYLVAKRTAELEGRDVRSAVRLDTAKEVVKDNKAKYDKLAEDIYEYQDHLLQYLVDSGVISTEAAGAMREANRNYVPFYRVMDESAKIGGGSGGKSLTAKNPIKRIKGSGRDIIDPLESILKNTYTLIDMAERNQVGKALVKLAEEFPDNGGMIEKIPTPMSGQKVQQETILKAVKETSPEAYEMLKDALGGDNELAATMFSRSNFIDKANEISVLRDGKLEVYQVDPEIAKVMNGLGAEYGGLLMQALRVVGAPARWLRAGATLAPAFLFRNPIRDAVHAFVTSDSGFIPFVDSAKGIKEAAARSDLYWEWKKAGGAMASMVSMDRTLAKVTIEQLQKTEVVDRLWNVVTHPFEGLRVLSELSEEAARLGEFRKATRQLGDTKEGLSTAAMRTRDVSLDFARMGALTRVINMVVPFTNATVQSWVRFGETFRDNPVRTATRAFAALSVPSMAVAIYNYGDKRYEEIPQWQKDIAWCIPLGPNPDDPILRFPKPFEWGVLFGSSFERMMTAALDMYHGKELDKVTSEALEGFMDSVWDVAVPSITPTAVAPFVERWANLSTFFDKPIIPGDREGMLPQYQYTQYTTELTKSISALLGDMSLLGPEGTFSPATAENFVQAWTGGLGMGVLQLTDKALRVAGVIPDPVKPTGSWADIPVLNAFLVRYPSLNCQSIADFRRNYDKAQTYLKTITGLQKEMRYEDVQQYLPYSVYSALEGPQKALNNIYASVKNIQRNPTMTADEKRQLMDAMTFQAVEIARQGNEVFDAVETTLKGLAERK